MTVVSAFFRADWSFKLLVIRVFILLGIGRLSVIFFPFRKLAGWMGHVERESPQEVSAHHEQSLIRIASAINAVSKYTVWNSNCFAQALCAHWILKGRQWPHTIYFGVKKDEGQGMKAHAWLRAGDRIVTGIKGHKQYTALAHFAYLPTIPEN